MYRWDLSRFTLRSARFTVSMFLCFYFFILFYLSYFIYFGNYYVIHHSVDSVDFILFLHAC